MHAAHSLKKLRACPTPMGRHASSRWPNNSAAYPNPARAANNGCTDVITGYSATYGARNAAKLTRFQNQTAQWRAKGAITVRGCGTPHACLLQPAWPGGARRLSCMR